VLLVQAVVGLEVRFALAAWLCRLLKVETCCLTEYDIGELKMNRVNLVK
jgi:hypothetical protein